MLDYPRPPAVVPFLGRVRVIHRRATIADTVAAIRVLETSQAPAYYVPRADVDVARLEYGTAQSYCEWKGVATYWSVYTRGSLLVNCAWSYETPLPGYEEIQGYLAFYAQLMDECWVGDEQVVANPGSFYGGWVTSTIVGPIKGAPGTERW